MSKSIISSLVVIFLSLFVGTTFNTNNKFSLQENFDQNETQAIFRNSPLNVPNYLSSLTNPPNVLGNSSFDKKIYVDLSTQTLYAYEGEKLIYTFLISSGKWGRTPTGVFDIWGKFRYTKMSGGSKALNTYYYLPNVPYVMFFQNEKVAATRGFSIHGTYWHENFGNPMSHGCINMKTSEAAQIYEWSEPVIPEGKKSIRSSSENPGTQIIIYGKAPQS